MERRKFLQGLLAGSVSATTLAGAGSKALAQGATTKLVLLVGTAPPDPACHYFFYARENGFYRDRHLDVEIKPIAAETTAVRAIVAGEGDIAWVGAISTLRAISAGSKLKVLSVFTPTLDYLVVAQKDITSLKGLEGRSVAVSQVGAVSQLVPLLMIDQAGGDPSKVKWLSVGGSAARTQAIIAKRIEAAPLNSSFAARALEYNYLHTVGDAVKDLPNFVYAWEVVSENALQSKRQALQAFVTATSQGVRWAMQNPDKAAAISRKLLPDVPREEIDGAVHGYAKKHFFNESGLLSKDAWNFTVAALMKTGDIKSAPKYDHVVLTEFPTAADKALGAKKP